MIQGILKKVFKAREKLGADRGENPEAEKPFLEHLEDLRVMIVRIVATLFISLIICFVFNSTLIDLIRAPLSYIDVPVTTELADGEIEVVKKPLSEVMQNISIDPLGVFMLALKVSLLAAITVSIPFLIYFILQFVLPGLRENERKILWPAMAIGFGLFIMGVFFAYFVVVPRAMEFFYTFGVERGVEVQWTIELYTKFAVRFILIFGICFELPVVVMALVKLDILNYQIMSQRRGMALIIIFFVAAVITPTQDALTLTLLGAPMYILYEICIWLSYFIDKRDRANNPDLYEARDRIEAEIAAEADKPIQWGGFGSTDEGDDDDPHAHDDYHDEHHDPYHDEHHGEDGHDPHADEHGHDDYHDNLHDPDHDSDHSTLDDPDHGGGTRLDAGTSDEDQNDTGTVADAEDPHAHDPYHHDEYEADHYANDHDIHENDDEIDEYHQHLAEAEAAEQAAQEAEAAKKASESEDSTAKPEDKPEEQPESTADKAPGKDSQESVSTDTKEETLEDFSARDEATSESAVPSVTETPTGSALGDTTGLGNSPATAAALPKPDLESRIKDLESLVTQMANRLQALEKDSKD